jgi:uncharacterized protein (TIGR00369 family)
MTEPENFHSLVGVQILEWRDGFARIALDVLPKHLNGAGIIHGGMLMTLLDEAGSLCGLWCSVKGNRRFSVTVDLDCRFVGQAKGGRVFGTGEIVSHGRSLYFTRTEITDSEGRVLAYGASSHKWRRGSESVEGVPRP